MKTSLTTLVLLLAFTFSTFAQSPAFNGAWKLNKEKSTIDYNQIFLAKINIQVKGDSLLTTRVYQDPDGQEYPFVENLTLNGKESKINIYDMPRVTKAQKGTDGSILIESKTTFYGDSGEENLIAKETWKTADQGKTIILDFTNLMMGQETKGMYYFIK